MKFSHIKLYVLSLFVGILTGFVTIPYRYLLEKSDIFRAYFFVEHHSWWFHLLTVAIMWIIALFIYISVKKFPIISGSGIPQVEGAIYGRFKFSYPFRLLIAKFWSGVAGIGMGLSLGREGPSVQMGGFIARIIGKWSKANVSEQRYLYTGGASAGLASAFTAPLASTIFIVEEIEKFDSVKIIITSLLASTVSAWMASIILPTNIYAPIQTTWPEEMSTFSLFITFIFFSILLTGAGKLFNSSLLNFQKKFKQMPIPIYWKILIIILLTYLLGFFCTDLLTGGERFLIQQSSPLAYTGIVYLTIIIFIKIFYTPLCYATGFPGGIFLPLLVCGGLLGKWFSLILIQIGLLNAAHTGFFMVIGMSALFSVVVRSPITGIILILEMTQKFNILFPMIIVVSLSYFFSQIVNVKPIYDMLYQRLLPTGLQNSDRRITISFNINDNSYMINKCPYELQLPQGCTIFSAKRHNQELSLKKDKLKSGDELYIELYSRDLETLYRPLRSMANE